MESENSVVVAAPSVEEAIIIGLTRLTAMREEVNIEVLDEGNRGFLGIGSREARVRVTRKPPEAERPSPPSRPQTVTPVEPVTEPEPEPDDAHATAPLSEAPPSEALPSEAPQVQEPQAQAPHVTGVPVAEPAPRVGKQAPAPPKQDRAQKRPAERSSRQRDEGGRGKRPQREPRPQRQTTTQELDREKLAAIVTEITSNLLPGLEIETSVTWLEEDRPTLWIDLGGRDADALVGPRARNLHAAQYLIRALIYRQLDGNYNVVVDADGYRKRRRRSLETLAESKADRAVELGHAVRLRPMPAHERRIVHITLRQDDRVTTESVGKGRDRAVTIVPQGSSDSST